MVFAATCKEPPTMTTATQTPESRSSTAAPGTCCGGPAPAGADACCAHDAAVKSAGGAGCGCGSAATPKAPAAPKTGCCG